LVTIRTIAIVAGVVAVVVVAGIAVDLSVGWNSAPSGASCDLPAPTGFQGGYSFVVVPCGTNVTIRPQYYVGYSLQRLSDGEMLVGALAVTIPTHATVQAYILNTTEFGQVQGASNLTGPPSGNFYSSGPVSSLNFTAPILPSPVQYYFVVENLSPVALHFVWSKNLMFYYDSTA
jgi:hypothetical protein